MNRLPIVIILACVMLLVVPGPVFAPGPPVGLSGQVTVTNTPLPVSLSNTSSTPLFVQDVNNPDFQPFAQECVADTFDSCGRASCSFGAVPAGKRFVIDTVSGELQIASGTKPISINMQVCAAGNATDNFFPAVFQGSSSCFTGDFFTVNQRVRLYADNTGGCHNPPFVNVTISDGTTGTATFVASGYLVNVP
jgi:hypothetical protein